MSDELNNTNTAGSLPDPATTSVEKPARSSVRRYLPAVVVVLIMLGIAGGFFLRAWLRRFPVIEPGSYIGAIHDLERGRDTTIYVERSGEESELLVVLFNEAFSPQKVALNYGPSFIGTREFLPIVLAGEWGAVTLTGEKLTSNRYNGRASTPRGSAQWYLSKIGDDSVERATGEEASLKLLLMLQAEISETERRTKEAELAIPLQSEEINKLSAFVTQGDLLKSRAQEKFGEAQAQLTQAQQEFKLRQEEAMKLERSVTISQKLRGVGKLTQLGRDILEREGRWIDSMYKTGGNAVMEAERAEAEQLQRVITIQKEIEAEKQRISELADG